MENIIRIAITAPYPPAYVLPEDFIRKRTLWNAKLQHPAPWVRAICIALSKKQNVKLAVFSHSRDIKKTHCAIKDGINYTFISKYERSA